MTPLQQIAEDVAQDRERERVNASEARRIVLGRIATTCRDLHEALGRVNTFEEAKKVVGIYRTGLEMRGSIEFQPEITACTLIIDELTWRAARPQTSTEALVGAYPQVSLEKQGASFPPAVVQEPPKQDRRDPLLDLLLS